MSSQADSGAFGGAVLEGNFIYVNAYPPDRRSTDERDQREIDRASGIAGFRLFQYGDSPNKRTDNTLFADNVIVAKAWPQASYIRARWSATASIRRTASFGATRSKWRP